MVLMFCGLADVLRYMVIYQQIERMLPRMSNGWSEDGTEKGRDAEMIPKSQQKAVAKYNKKHYKQVLVQMNMETDADILSFLETLPNGEKAGFIRRAIREYIKTLSL